MSSVPISHDDLEIIVSDCARDLLEKWAIESQLDDSELPQYAAMAADVATFIIDRYMEYMNNIMIRRAEEIGLSQ